MFVWIYEKSGLVIRFESDNLIAIKARAKRHGSDLIGVSNINLNNMPARYLIKKGCRWRECDARDIVWSPNWNEWRIWE